MSFNLYELDESDYEVMYENVSLQEVKDENIMESLRKLYDIYDISTVISVYNPLLKQILKFKNYNAALTYGKLHSSFILNLCLNMSILYEHLMKTNNKYLVLCEVYKTDLMFLLDTGASLTSISGQVFNMFKEDTEYFSYFGFTKLYTADGSENIYQLINVKSIKVSNSLHTNVTLVIAGQCLLGMDYLYDKIKIDITL